MNKLEEKNNVYIDFFKNIKNKIIDSQRKAIIAVNTEIIILY